MATFQNTREQAEQKVMVRLLSEMERNCTFTQRGLADEFGIALGLVNQYIKRCVTKGWVRASQVSPRRVTYFLTPEGFKEKGRMVKSYISSSLHFFRDARLQCEEAFAQCKATEWTNVALVGRGDLADIAQLVAQGTGVSVTVVDPLEVLETYDAVFITDIANPQNTYELIKKNIEAQKILTLALLHISRHQFTAEERI
jgi:DNA-binding MarR family transcriptional regulator